MASLQIVVDVSEALRENGIEKVSFEHLNRLIAILGEIEEAVKP